MASASVISPSVAYAQDAANDQAQSSATSGNDVITVTGSRIEGAKIDDILPVTVVDEELIEAINPASGDELFRSLPQAGAVNFNEQSGVGSVNFARGDIASINLRELGTGNTLLLLNGRRMALDPGFQTELLVPAVSPDTNTIMPGSVRRVEVLRDGASAIYGADAVAGVVNTVLRGGRDGGFVQGDIRKSDGIDLWSGSIRGGFGFDFNEGRSNITLYGGWFHENGVPASVRSYAGNSDQRFNPALIGTPFEGDLNFDNRSSLSPWGQFDIQGAGASSATAIGDDDFQIQPDSLSGCRLDLGNGLCADNGTTVDQEIRFDRDNERTLFSDKDRYNASVLFNHEFNPGLELYFEGSYYRSEASRLIETSALLSAVPIAISREAYWNPFGAAVFANGVANPNRLASGINGVGPEGRDLLLERYRVVDPGPRTSITTKDDYRIVLGLRGELGNWDFDTGFVYHDVRKDNLTLGRISNTLLENQINLSTPDAYNPFNGGCFDPTLSVAAANGDCTPSAQAALDAIQVDVFRNGGTTLLLGDFKVSRNDLFKLPGGDLGVAAGVEFRRETFFDDRDPRLDGTITYTNSVTGDFFGSDVVNSSPSPDTSGNREVYSGYLEAFVPIISEDMNIPVVQELSVQLAGRFEYFSDIKETAIVPRVAASWTVFEGVMLRGAWSQGFRAPNLVQVNDLGTTRANSRDDFVRCFAQIQQGIIASFDNCVGEGTVSLRTGTNVLQPEETESINLGIVFTPEFLPGLALTADYWQVEQKGIVGVFGDANAIALDLLRRINGSSNPNVIRNAPEADDILLFEGTGLEPVGRIAQVLDPYLNLDGRDVGGWDFGMAWNFGDVLGLGKLEIGANAAYLEKFIQSPGPDGTELLAAIANGDLPDSLTIANIGELREQNGRPKWRWTANLSLESGPLNFRLFGQYVGGVFDTSALQDTTDINGNPNPDPGSPYRVDDMFTLNASIGYRINSGALDGTSFQLGINNLFGEDPPLADSDFSFIPQLHSARGRQLTFRIRKNF
ncbi:TonB-dependent receptor domain-containing protein [Qipengyuania sp. ASV99]|uniref:TonB-dependent receptor domain-containing protein n=1 Tax=Qipengyuania sp. ASV99 TaxID=3399681 RepID=UPI003A4C58C8